MLVLPCRFVVLAAVAVPLLLASETPAAPRSAPAPRKFVHPGILVAQADLDRIRKDVAAKKQPTYNAYVLANTSTTMAYGGMPPVKMWSLEYVPHPQIMCSNGSGITANREDSLASYTHALLWAITLDERHAQKSIEIMDGWTAIKQPPFDLANGLQVAWGAAVWPRAAEIIRYSYNTASGTKKPWAGAEAFGAWMHQVFLPFVDQGASTNGNIGLVMTEAAVAIAVYNENTTVFDTSIARWRQQAPAYLYVKSDGPTPKRPPMQRYLAHTAPTCEPDCTDAQMVTFWHGQSIFGSGKSGRTDPDKKARRPKTGLKHINTPYRRL